MFLIASTIPFKSPPNGFVGVMPVPILMRKASLVFHTSRASCSTIFTGLLYKTPPSKKDWPCLPIRIGSKKVGAAEVARHACHIVHSSKRISASLGFLYDRKSATYEVEA